MDFADKVLEYLPETAQVGDTSYQWIDGDTLKDTETGNSVRIQNINTQEVAHARDVTEGRDKPPSAQGRITTKAAADLARAKGFTQVHLTGSKDTYGRELGDLVNPETGELFSNYMLRNDLTQPNAFSDETSKAVYYKGLMEREAGIQDTDAALARSEIYRTNQEASDGNLPWKTIATNSREYNSNPEVYSGMAIRELDRNLQGEAYNQWSTSFDTALIGMSESYHGFKQILGDMVGNEDLKLAGEIGAAKARYRISLNPTTTVDLSQIEGVGDFVDYVANNAAMSIPYMATTVGGALAGSAAGSVLAGPMGTVGGAVAGGSIGLMGPTAIYAGQVYNAQEEKNYKVAMMSGFSQAVFDRIGLKGISGSGKSLKRALKEAQDELVKQGMTKQAALDKITDASRKELVSFMDDSIGFAKRQIGLRNVSRDVISSATKAFGAEAVTEAVQETLATMGENWNIEGLGIREEGEFTDDFINRITNAAVAGGSIGGAFGTVGGVKEVGRWADVHHDLKDADKNITDSDRYAAEAIANGDAENEAYLRNMRVSDMEHVTDAAFRMTSDQERKAKRSTGEKTIDSIYAVRRFFPGQVRAMLNKPMLDKSPTARRFGSLFGGHLNKIHAGKTYEDALHFNMTKYMRVIGNPKKVYQNYDGRNDRNSRKAFNAKFHEIAADKVKHDEYNFQNETNVPYDWSKWSQKDATLFSDLFNKLDRIENEMRVNQNRAWMSGDFKAKPKFSKLNNYLLKYKTLMKPEIEARRGEFIGLLQSEYGLNSKDSAELVNSMLEGEPADGVDNNVFNMLSRGLHPGSSKKRTMGLSANPKFQSFFDQDVMSNIHEAARSAARFESYHDYIGKDKWKINQMFQMMQNEGLSGKEVDELASHFENYIQSQSGNYKRPKPDTAGHRALTMQKSILTYSLLTALPLSAFSSMVEIAHTSRGMTKDQLFNKKTGLNNMGYELATMAFRGMQRVADEAWTGHENVNESDSYQMLEHLGFLGDDVGAATTTGATELSETKKNLVTNFFKYNGLQGLTNTTRAIRGAMAMDFIMNHLNTIKVDPEKSESVRYAREQLRDLGLNVDRIADLIERDNLSQNDQKYLQDAMDTATFTFINDAVALPGAANRPLFYQDPRLALFTQFNGYMATFTAHHIPKMWGEYIKRGKPSMKFNTFAMMATMILLGFVSQYLKDLIKYGQASPYLDDQQKIRRAINSSGLLGSSERILGLVFPTFEKSKNQNAAEYVFDTVTGEIPAAGPLQRLYKVADSVYEGEHGKAVYNAARATPGIGPLTNLAQYISGQ